MFVLKKKLIKNKNVTKTTSVKGKCTCVPGFDWVDLPHFLTTQMRPHRPRCNNWRRYSDRTCFDRKNYEWPVICGNRAHQLHHEYSECWNKVWISFYASSCWTLIAGRLHCLPVGGKQKRVVSLRFLARGFWEARPPRQTLGQFPPLRGLVLLPLSPTVLLCSCSGPR